jgi:hypothetical protein
MKFLKFTPQPSLDELSAAKVYQELMDKAQPYVNEVIKQRKDAPNVPVQSSVEGGQVVFDFSGSAETVRETQRAAGHAFKVKPFAMKVGSEVYNIVPPGALNVSMRGDLTDAIRDAVDRAISEQTTSF